MMKSLNAISFVTKAFLSVAGIVYLINRLHEKNDTHQYKFTIDSAINHDMLKVNNKFLTQRKFNFADLQKAYFRSKDR